MTPGVPITFTASLLHTAEGPPAVQWLVNGEVVSESASFTHVPTAATTSIELRVTDPTRMVYPQMANGALTKTRAWTLHTTGLPRRRAASH